MTRHAIAPSVLFVGLVCHGCATPPANPADIRRVVEEGLRALYERGDYATYISIFAPGSKMVLGRGAEPADTDNEFSFEQFSRSRKLRFDGLPPKNLSISFAHSQVSIRGDRATVRQVTSFTGRDYKEEMQEEYEMRRTPEGWRITSNRFWPIQIGSVMFDEAKWQQLDAAVASSRKEKDLASEAGWLMESLRSVDAWRVAKRWTAAEPARLDAWFARAYSAAVIGESEDALAAFGKVRDLDPNVGIPEYAVARLANRRK